MLLILLVPIYEYCTILELLALGYFLSILVSSPKQQISVIFSLLLLRIHPHRLLLCGDVDDDADDENAVFLSAGRYKIV